MALVTLNLHVDDSGVPFEVTPLGADGVTSLDLSTATLLLFRFQKPDGSYVEKTAEYATVTVDGDTHGVVRYDFAPGDLDQAGSWWFQLHIEIDGDVVNSDLVKFKVLPNLPKAV